MRKRTSSIWKIDKTMLEKIVNESQTISNVLKYFNLKNIGGNYLTLKNRLIFDNINFSHITLGKGANKGKKFYPKAIPLEKILTINSSYNRYNLKKRLVKANLLKYKCAVCGLVDWNNKPLSLELDHINGINDDNRIENLRLICPNCHSQTPTHAGKNVKHKKLEKICGEAQCPKIKMCDGCGGMKVNNNLNLCLKCANKKNRKVERPSKEVLEKMIWEIPTTHIAKHFGVSDKAISKWATGYGLSKPPVGYWTKKKFEIS